MSDLRLRSVRGRADERHQHERVAREPPQGVAHLLVQPPEVVVDEEAFHLRGIELQQFRGAEPDVGCDEIVGLDGRPRRDDAEVRLAGGRVSDAGNTCLRLATLLVQSVQEQQQRPRALPPAALEPGRVHAEHGVRRHLLQPVEAAFGDVEPAQLDVDGDRCQRVGACPHGRLGRQLEERRRLADAALAEEEQPVPRGARVYQCLYELGEGRNVAGAFRVVAASDQPVEECRGVVPGLERVARRHVLAEAPLHGVEMHTELRGCPLLLVGLGLTSAHRALDLGQELRDHCGDRGHAGHQPDRRRVEFSHRRGDGGHQHGEREQRCADHPRSPAVRCHPRPAAPVLNRAEWHAPARDEQRSVLSTCPALAGRSAEQDPPSQQREACPSVHLPLSTT